MKRIAILMVTALMSLAAAAAPIRYFTQSQVARTVSYLNAQKELMIYCGYDYEIETYVLLNEVWAERVNSSYYELWVFGYDAYTGEEIYMPLDLQCVWLYSAGRMYSAAQYLRFYSTARPPQITWYVPVYNPYTRIAHRSGYVRTYHYDVHCHGWMPPAPPVGGYGPGMPPPPMHPYYMRAPQTPAPRPATAWTPGVDRPQVSVPDAAGRTDAPRSSSTTATTRPSAQPSGTARTGSTGTAPTRSSSTTTTTPTRSSGTTTTTPTRSSGTTTTTPTRSSSTTTTTPTRSSGTTTTTPTRSSGTTTTTPTRSSGTTTTTPTRSSGTTTTTPTRSSTTTATPTRSSSSSVRSTSNDNKNGGTTTASRSNTTSSRNTAGGGTSGRGNNTRR